MHEISEGLSQAFNVEMELTYTQLPGAVVNDENLTDQAIEVAKEVGYHVHMMTEPLTIGEDFSGYTKDYPGVLRSLVQIVSTIYIILNMILMNVSLKSTNILCETCAEIVKGVMIDFKYCFVINSCC